MLKGKRAQTEVIGLLVIVILLVFFGLIYLGFASMKDSNGLESLRTNIEGENALNALMKVKMGDYEGMTVEEMIIKCSVDSEGCRMLEEGIARAYEVILRPGVEYGFKAFREDEEIHGFGNCEVGIVSSYIFIEDGVAYEAALKLCER